jgi:hypothetical protein
MTVEKPRYEHDCDNCDFLGRHEEYDLYYHPNRPEWYLPSVIARWSSDGPDYISGLAFVPQHSALFECYLRATRAGLVDGETAARVLTYIDGRAR